MATVQLIFVSVMFACTIQIIHAFWEPTARINNSNIIGKIVTFAGIPVHQYLGIPYAEPPLGDLMYRKPKPIESYPEVFRADEQPKACYQYPYSPFPWAIRGEENLSEDCLYLNIWAPVGANWWNKKAVMYWIHGGGYRYGGIRSPYYDGTRLAALGNIIVVTVNYRLEYFGFLTTNSPDAPGNLGVWDILEGLRWVNKYIPAFGGDVSRITIAGQGEGAIVVGLLSISPLSKGLYARQIMESGSPAYRRGDNNTQNIMLSNEIAIITGCEGRDNITIYNNPEEVISCIKDRDPGSVKMMDFSFTVVRNASYSLIPQFGDEILMENPRLSVINNNFRCTDLLIGTNKDEGAYTLTGVEYLTWYFKEDQHVNRSTGEQLIRYSASTFPDPEAIVNYYLPPTLQDDTNFTIRHQVYTANGDTVIACPTVYYAEKCAEQKKNVYFYHFNHQPSNPPFGGWANWALFNVTHFDEVPFVFGLPAFNTSYTISEGFLSIQVIHIWSSFVKYGKPNIPWPLFSKENPSFKYIGPDFVTSENGRGPHSENCEFLRPHFGF